MGSWKTLLFITLLHLLLVPASGSEEETKLFYVDGGTGTVTLGKKNHFFSDISSFSDILVTKIFF